MSSDTVVQIIRSKFANASQSMEVPKLRGGSFTAVLTEEGVWVSNLAKQPFLPWRVFEAAVDLLEINGGHALRGDAMRAKLGQPGLPLNSVEGHIAHRIYDRQPGHAVFRRIVPIACILIWAEICEPKPGQLSLMSHNLR